MALGARIALGGFFLCVPVGSTYDCISAVPQPAENIENGVGRRRARDVARCDVSYF
jgi:hypothetical protein